LGFYQPLGFLATTEIMPFLGGWFDSWYFHRETATEDESGIEGILNRLEKQRNLTFGVGLKEKGNGAQFPINRGKDDWQPGTLLDTVCQFCKF